MTMVRAANIDADGVYWGLEDRGASTLAAGDVVFFAEEIAGDPVDGVTYIKGDNDLAPGRYRWDPEARSFNPLEPQQTRDAPDAPSLEKAFNALLVELERQGTTLPRHADEWRVWFARTRDGR